jgi:D-alanine--poly(phosphoribitol) ligase subunit 1
MTFQPGLSFLERFIAAAEASPDHAAVVQAGTTTSYGELLRLARRIAQALLDARPGARVAIHLPQGAAAYAAMFGCSMAGSTYAPLNVAAPFERIAGVVAKYEPDIVLTSQAGAHDAARLAPHALRLDIEGIGAAALSRPMSAPELVYVMFTSGSTGQPKGVMIPFDALSHYVDWALPAMGVTRADRWSQHPNIAFDLSVLDIFAALCGGATLYPITQPGDLAMPASAIQRYQLTIWNSVPSVMTSMVKIRSVSTRNMASLRLLTFCGEPLLPMHLEAIFKAAPGVTVQNTYGPTEATVSCTAVDLTADNHAAACGASVAIGEAIPGMQLHLVGGDHADEGEIVITGPQVAAGYWRDDAQTAASFRLHDGQRAYYTGDWARRSNGHIFFVGRRDQQVKVRGERIELDDLAAAVTRAGWGPATVVFVDDVLVAFIESAAPAPQADEYKAAMKRLLPPHLVPQRIHALATLPRNANDKIDRLALARLARQDAPTRISS